MLSADFWPRSGPGEAKPRAAIRAAGAIFFLCFEGPLEAVPQLLTCSMSRAPRARLGERHCAYDSCLLWLCTHSAPFCYGHRAIAAQDDSINALDSTANLNEQAEASSSTDPPHICTPHDHTARRPRPVRQGAHAWMLYLAIRPSWGDQGAPPQAELSGTVKLGNAFHACMCSR